MQPRLISVIVRTVDRNDKLAEALTSLVKQTFRDFETIIVDMSAGGVDQLVDGFRNELPSIQHLRFGKVLPRATSLNEGIRYASSSLIAILDDDNTYEPEHLETLVNGLQSLDTDLVYTGVRRATYTPNGELIDVAEWNEDFDLNRLLVGNYIHTAGTAFRKTTWEELGGYDHRFPVYEDYDFLLRVAAKGTIEHVRAVTAESRSFTGKAGVQNHALGESQTVLRCQAGIRWKHRALFSSLEVKRATSEMRASYDPTGSDSKVVRLIRKLHLRSDKALELLGWWWYHSWPDKKGERRDCLPLGTQH